MANIMLDRVTGRVIHIDFGDCFEVLKFRSMYPETIPFRLTRMLTKAMGRVEWPELLSTHRIVSCVFYESIAILLWPCWKHSSMIPWSRESPANNDEAEMQEQVLHRSGSAW